MQLSRRGFLSGAALVAAVGFDPVRRSWVTEANADGGSCRVPKLDGQFLTTAEALDAAADDYGRYIHHRPVAVLKPASRKDIAKIVQYARECRVDVAMRGQGHSTHGQAQVNAGIVIDSSSMTTIHEASLERGILVDAGARWRQVLDVCIPLGLTPPVLPDYLDLTVGGNLSGAGVDGTSARFGGVIDNVIELEVVTGKGEIVKCSASETPDLFNAALGGLGQFGIITRARLRAIPAPQFVRRYDLTYLDAATLLEDMKVLALDGRFDHLEAEAGGLTAIPGTPASEWPWNLLAGKWFAPGSTPDDGALLEDLNFSAMRVTDVPYYEFLKRIDGNVELAKAFGLWQLPHPWFDMFIPGSRMDDYLDETLPELDATALGPVGIILLYPMRKSRFTRPFFMVPNEEVFFLFDILPNQFPDQIATSLQRNRQLYERARDIGGKRYCIGSLDLTQTDWRDHFGPAWTDFEDAKRRYDPAGILTPGQGIFG